MEIYDASEDEISKENKKKILYFYAYITYCMKDF
jgi:hypothetical protein